MASATVPTGSAQSPWHGVALAFALGALAVVAGVVLPRSVLRSDILVVLVAGGLIANTPIGRVIGLGVARDDGGEDRFQPGLRLVGSTVLRGAVVLMGLRVQPSFFRVDDLAVIAGVIATTVPSAFFVAQVVGAWLGVRRPLVDLIAGGTMICGATAAAAIAPVVGARRDEQGIAIATIFLFSVVALVAMHPIAVATGLDPSYSGLWSGLAVNDFSSAIAVGQQMGGIGGIMAANSKSTRILLLTPTLMLFRLLRADVAPVDGVARVTPPLLPGYLLGYLGAALLRVAGDESWGVEPWWHDALRLNDVVVNYLIVSVAGSIGLQLEVRRFVTIGGRAVVVGAVTSVWTAGVSLALLVLVERTLSSVAWIVGGASLALTAGVYRGTRGARAEPSRARPVDARMRAVQAALALVLFALPFGLGAMRTVSLLRRRRAANRATPTAVVTARVRALRQSPYDVRCPAGMVYVTGGRYAMGSDDHFNEDELPIHDVTVASFCLDRAEVTTGEYLTCAREGRCAPLDNTVAWPDLSDRDAAQWDALCNGNRADRMEHPVNCVNWVQADAYCRGHGARLPTEREWEYAARGGSEQRRFAWGEEAPTPERANLCGVECAAWIESHIRGWSPLFPERDPWIGTAPIGSYPDTRWGLKDMTGNVTEWLSSLYCPYPDARCDTDERCARGNGFLANLLAKVRVARRNHDVPWHRSPDAGFRCARSPSRD